MAIITLTTDLGTKDSYLASIKGAIYSQLEDVQIIDITHSIDPFNIQQAAFVLRSCYKDFPPGTIHVISVDDELSITNEHLAIKSGSYYFIGADNGLFSLLFDTIKADKLVRLNISQSSNCQTFATKNIFVPAACHLARGGTMEIIGSQVLDLEIKRMELKPVFNKDMLKGSIIYVDHYGNAISNISRQDFIKYNKKGRFTILFGREDEQIIKISEKYKDVSISEKLAIFGENNFLQIAINQGRANKLLGLKLHDTIRIEFK
mgnify:CR=1 FL=1|tara:strand:+ start:209 stop:994 length:786 start_codon:yes stop_codon:yes gene_type:complete